MRRVGVEYLFLKTTHSLRTAYIFTPESKGPLCAGRSTAALAKKDAALRAEHTSITSAPSVSSNSLKASSLVKESVNVCGDRAKNLPILEHKIPDADHVYDSARGGRTHGCCSHGLCVFWGCTWSQASVRWIGRGRTWSQASARWIGGESTHLRKKSCWEGQQQRLLREHGAGQA